MKPELAAPGERVLGAVSKDAYPGVAPDSICRYHSFPELDALVREHDQPRIRAPSGDQVLGAGGERARRPHPVHQPDPGRDPGAEHAGQLRPRRRLHGGGPNERWGYGKASEEVGTAPLPSDLRITVDALPGGVKDKPYNLVLTASGGTLPYTWSPSRVRCPREWSWRARGCSLACRRAAAPSRSPCR